MLVLCMSANAFGSDPDWSGLEAGTFRFRDPLNQERRFIPLRLDDAPIKGSPTKFHSGSARHAKELLGKETCRATHSHAECAT